MAENIDNEANWLMEKAELEHDCLVSVGGIVPITESTSETGPLHESDQSDDLQNFKSGALESAQAFQWLASKAAIENEAVSSVVGLISRIESLTEATPHQEVPSYETGIPFTKGSLAHEVPADQWLIEHAEAEGSGFVSVGGILSTSLKSSSEDCPQDSFDKAVHFASENPVEHRMQSVSFPETISSKRDSLRIVATREPSIFIDRQDELKRLDLAWGSSTTNVFSIVGQPGSGKTTLLFEWMNRMNSHRWFGAGKVFEWSFYCQPSYQGAPVSADQFAAEALRFFGDPDFATSSAPPEAKGERLAKLVSQSRNLLLLDGIESLQHHGRQGGYLKDVTLKALLIGLVQHNPGLCIITSRFPVSDLIHYEKTAAQALTLHYLSEDGGANVLKSLGVHGELQHLKGASRDCLGHPLTLHLLGCFLSKICRGDVNKRSLIDWNKTDADAEREPAWIVLEAHKKWLLRDSLRGERQLALLRLLSLFDYPIETEILASFRNRPAIKELNASLIGCSQKEWDSLLTELHTAGLIAFRIAKHRRHTKKEKHNTPLLELEGYADYRPLDVPEQSFPLSRGGAHLREIVDMHPLVRDYFANELLHSKHRLWERGHMRVYSALKRYGPSSPTSPDSLFKLYRIIVHACRANCFESAFEEIYWKRLLQGHIAVNQRLFPATFAHLDCLKLFFKHWPWKLHSPLSEKTRVRILDESGLYAFMLGELSTGAELLKRAIRLRCRRSDWLEAARDSRLIREIYLLMGDFTQAIDFGNMSVEFAEKSGDAIQQLSEHSGLAQVFHYVGRVQEAACHFEKAILLQRKSRIVSEQLVGMAGYWYCEFLIDQHEFEKARILAETLLNTAERQGWRADAGHAHMVLGKLIASDLSQADGILHARTHLDNAVTIVLRNGQRHHLVTALLTRAWLFGEVQEISKAKRDLLKAQALAEASGMRIHLADIHLRRASILRDKDELLKARSLIERCGYWRRIKELEQTEIEAKEWVSLPRHQ